MEKCKLLDMEIPLRKICPVSKNFEKRFICYADCGFSTLRDKNKKIIIKMKKKVQTKLQTKLIAGEEHIKHIKHIKQKNVRKRKLK